MKRTGSRLVGITRVIAVVAQAQGVGPRGVNEDGGCRRSVNRSGERAVVQDNALRLWFVFRNILAATGQEAGSGQPQEQTR